MTHMMTSVYALIYLDTNGTQDNHSMVNFGPDFRALFMGHLQPPRILIPLLHSLESDHYDMAIIMHNFHFFYLIGSVNSV